MLLTSSHSMHSTYHSPKVSSCMSTEDNSTQWTHDNTRATCRAARTAVKVQTLKGKIYWSVASKPNPLSLKNSKNSPVCACVAYMHCICACAYCNNTSTIKTFYKYQQLIHSVHFRTPYFICRKSSCPHLLGTSFGSQIQQKNGLTTPSSKALKHWLLRGSPSLRSKEPMSISIVWTHCHINSL
jgi:hypothetical protein